VGCAPARVHVGIADPGEEAGIGEGALERVVLGSRYRIEIDENVGELGHPWTVLRGSGSWWGGATKDDSGVERSVTPDTTASLASCDDSRKSSRAGLRRQ
jgi:hypothetical protein